MLSAQGINRHAHELRRFGERDDAVGIVSWTGVVSRPLFNGLFGRRFAPGRLCRCPNGLDDDAINDVFQGGVELCDE
jgi:hypothetical protein